MQTPRSGGEKCTIHLPIAEMERRLILATLEQFEGAKKKVADILEISLKTLYNRLREYGTD
jgi:DNA-binding NtrC family response regulator